MHLGIRAKIFLILIGTAFAVLAASAMLTQWSFERSFLGYVNELEGEGFKRRIQSLADLYAEEGSWDRLRGQKRGWPRPARREAPHGRWRDPLQTRPRDGPGPRPPPIALFDAAGKIVLGRPDASRSELDMPIRVDDEIVGYAQFSRLTDLHDQLDVRFASEHSRWVFGIALLLLALATLAALYLSRKLVNPLQALAAGTRALRAGQFERRIDVASKDELGRLAADFNSMAQTLERNRGQQRQWLADVSHELRTPVAVLRGEIDALRDGLRRTDAAALASLAEETERLGKLIDDLYELSVADVGRLELNKTRVELDALVAAEAVRFESRLADAGLALNVQAGATGAVVEADPARLRQLLINLLENSLRYTDSGGEVRLTTRSAAGQVELDVDDSAPTVADGALPRLFDRLYRADSSRDRRTGGAGIGLALCAKIVAAHGGRIEASHSDLGGVRIRVGLPLATDGGGAP